MFEFVIRKKNVTLLKNANAVDEPIYEDNGEAAFKLNLITFNWDLTMYDDDKIIWGGV